MGFANPIVGGMAALIRAAIRSPNYVAGVSGWSINKDGTAEFQDATIRGTILAATIIGSLIESSATNPSVQFDSSRNAFFAYDTNNHLRGSATTVAGTDFFGSFYLDGVCGYTKDSTGVWHCVQTGGQALSAAGITLRYSTNGTNFPTAANQCVIASTIDVDPATGNLLVGKRGDTAVVPQLWAYDPTVVPATTKETWHPMALLNSWVNDTTNGPVMQYRLNALGKLEIQGFMKRTTGVTASTFFTLPSGYFNPSQNGSIREPMFAGFVTGWFYVSLDNAGNLNVNASTAITEAQFDTSFTIS